MTSPYRSPQSTHYGTQRSLEIEIRTDPTRLELADLQPFVNEHSTSIPLPSNYETISRPGANFSQLVVRVAHASDASTVAMAVGRLGYHAAPDAYGVEITHVVVRTSQRRRGYGTLALQKLLLESRRHGCVLATASATAAAAAPSNGGERATGEMEKVASRLLRSTGFQRSEVFGFIRHLAATGNVVVPSVSGNGSLNFDATVLPSPLAASSAFSASEMRKDRRTTLIESKRRKGGTRLDKIFYFLFFNFIKLTTFDSHCCSFNLLLSFLFIHSFSRGAVNRVLGTWWCS